MIVTNYSDARQRLASLFDATVDDAETIIVTRRRNENVVILSESEYNNMLENLYIRSDRYNYERLLASIDEAKRGKLTRHELVESYE